MNADERARLAALRKYRILDTEPERAFDDLTLLASEICNTPIALITLVDADRQWFKSKVGLSIQETSRSVAFCSHAIRQRELFLVPDTLLDDRFRDNPLVTGEPRIRFYTGAPLVTSDGFALGTLCVIDREPRTLSPDQLEALDALRRQAVAQLELRRNLDELERALRERDRAEAEREHLIEELRESLDKLDRLSGLVPYCSACKFDMVVPADVREIPRVSDAVMPVVRQRGYLDAEQLEIKIALEEALANAIKHGCAGDPSKSVQCCVAFDDEGGMTIVVRDPGTGFDPASVPSPVVGAGPARDSGRGIFLINQFMDEVRFEEGGRAIQLRKRGRVADEAARD